MVITVEKLNKVSPAIKGVYGRNIATALSEICPQYGINTYDIFHEFIANLLHECAEFTRFEENMNYSVNGLINGFGRHRITVEQARAFGRVDGKRAADKVAIANTLYGGKWGLKNLGNTLPNDGWLLRGSGAIQNTGRAVIGGFAENYNKQFGTTHDIFKMAELLRTDLKIAIHGACWFFAVYKKLIPYAIDDKFITTVEKINGARKGLEDRQKYLGRAVKVFI